MSLKFLEIFQSIGSSLKSTTGNSAKEPRGTPKGSNEIVVIPSEISGENEFEDLFRQDSDTRPIKDRQDADYLDGRK